MISWERKSNEFLMHLWKWGVISDLLIEAVERTEEGAGAGCVSSSSLRSQFSCSQIQLYMLHMMREARTQTKI